MQAQFMALDCVAEGSAVIHETIFENRFMHVNELIRLGAEHHGGRPQRGGHRRAPVVGRHRHGRPTCAPRPACVIAGLVAEGETLVDRIYHLDRGYDRMEAKLRGDRRRH